MQPNSTVATYGEVRDEMWAIRRIAEALDEMDQETCSRILTWAHDRYVLQPERDRMKPCTAGPPEGDDA